MFPEQFNLLSIFTLLAGLAFFLFGMNVMSGGLEKMSGGKLETGLQKLTSNNAKGLALGAGITIAIQSSSAMTVMLVGFVNSGIMQLSQTISVMMGSNVGTTLTAWITALNGINGGGSAILNALKPESFSPVFALVGIMLIMLGKNDKKKQLGTIFIGFSILMYGMIFMSDSMSPLKDMPEFESILKMFSNPILGVLIATALTGIIQSSAATIAILQALALSGGITYKMAIPLILGANIGTCATALLSSFGVNKNAKRVTAVHISIKVIGTVIVLGIFYLLDFFVDFAFKDYKINAVEIAIVHTVFNLVTTAMLLPFSK
ncbi:MAG: Na/Pi cotransporter family protein, partial [Clostridia bacterium]|nr:Na/Pi cotransporter family protein [Clostridia bacterium]